MEWLVPLFFLTALIYSMAGFGGGSTYLALLVLFGLPYESIPKIALLCNLVVVSGSFIHFYRRGHFSLTRVLPFVLTSIPLAYLGGRIPISEDLFMILLGLTLAIAGLHLLLKSVRPELVEGRICGSTSSPRTIVGIGVAVGGAVGFLSGLVGIGGGIFLAPILYFLRWGDARQIAATACFFILVNSAAGLLGQLTKVGMTVSWSEMLPLAIAVLIGGQIGSRFAVGKMPLMSLQRVTAAIILLVAMRILGGVL